MGKKLLLYGLTDLPSILAAESAARPFGAEVRVVGQAEYRVPVGLLAEGKTAAAEPFSGTLPGQMIVLCGVEDCLDGLLAALRAAGLGGCDKAVLTASNRNWDGLRLMAELKKERAALERRGGRR